MRILNVKMHNFWMLLAQWCRVFVAHVFRPMASIASGGCYQAGAVSPESRLSAVVIRAGGGPHESLGIVSTKVVTTGFVNFVVDQLQASTGQIANFRHHGMGTGATAEAVGDTSLGTQVESRVSGTQVEGASANIYRSVGTITATATRAVTEHGLFDAASGGNLMDRSVFAVINLGSGDAIQFTYELTVPAGS